MVESRMPPTKRPRVRKPAVRPAERADAPALKVYIFPPVDPKNPVGGVQQVIIGQKAGLTALGVEIVEKPDAADIIATHIIASPTLLKQWPEKVWVHHCHGLYWSEYDWHQSQLQVNVDVMEAIRVSDAVVVPTEWVAQAIRRHTNRDVRVIAHGIDPAEWPVTADTGYIYWDKSRPDPVCDPRPMNEVAALLPQFRFISTFGQPGPNITLTGSLDYDVAKETMRHAAVYLATTRETGQGISVLEAFAAGVPVAGFRWGGVGETVTHGVDGYLAEPGDWQGLANGVAWCLDHRSELSLNASATATRFPWSMAAGAYKALYEELLLRKARPKVSVIVTAYKLEKYLPAALESVRQQVTEEGKPFDDWECIVVDDASPDRCGAMADAAAALDPRFRAVHNQRNQYLAESRNIGIGASRGSYIIPLDADDRLGPAALSILSTALDRDRTIHVAYGNVEFIDEVDDRHWHSGWPVEFEYDQLMRTQGQPMPYSSMYRREAWELTGGYRSRCRSSEDQDMWLRLPSYGFRPKYVTGADTLIYLNREGSMSREQGWRNHRAWFPWAASPELAPSGALTAQQLAVHSCSPPAISVIIPVGPGHEKLVVDAVDSVDAQTFRQWEVIVVNDTGHDLARLPQWVRQIRTSGSIGVAAARNKGVRASLAGLFLPLDADDFLQPEALMMMFDACISGDGLPVVYTDFWENPERCYPANSGTPPNGVEILTDGHGQSYWEPRGAFVPYRLDDYQPRLLLNGFIHAVTALTPKALWEEVGGYDEKIAAWEDWDFQLKTASVAWPSRRIALPLWTYRKNTGLRRNEHYARFEESKAAILAKWQPYWTGERSFMPCSSCSGRNSSWVPQGTANVPAPLAPSGLSLDWVELEFLGGAAQTWKGQTGKVYRMKPGVLQLVDPVDAAYFQTFLQQFRAVAAGPSTEARAAGPTAAAEMMLVAEGPP